jgi:hypothetical protein
VQQGPESACRILVGLQIFVGHKLQDNSQHHKTLLLAAGLQSRMYSSLSHLILMMRQATFLAFFACGACLLCTLHSPKMLRRPTASARLQMRGPCGLLADASNRFIAAPTMLRSSIDSFVMIPCTTSELAGSYNLSSWSTPLTALAIPDIITYCY